MTHLCSLNSSATQAANFKKAKERVTILGYSNASVIIVHQLN